MKAAPVELVHVRRSGLHEGTHYGSVVITAADGSIEAHPRGRRHPDFSALLEQAVPGHGHPRNAAPS